MPRQADRPSPAADRQAVSPEIRDATHSSSTVVEKNRRGTWFGLGHPLHSGTNNSNVEVLVLVKNFGASRGMILVTEFRAVSDVHDELIDRGYGYSTLSEPTNEKEDVDADDLEAAIDMLRDWGWGGTGDPPEWY